MSGVGFRVFRGLEMLGFLECRVMGGAPVVLLGRSTAAQPGLPYATESRLKTLSEFRAREPDIQTGSLQEKGHRLQPTALHHTPPPDPASRASSQALTTPLIKWS